MATLPDIKTITDLLKKGLTLEAQEQIMALREAAIDLKAENTDLKEELAELRAKNDMRAKVIWGPPYYVIQNGDTKDGPFCPLCYDKDQQLIRLQRSPMTGGWKCHSCKNLVSFGSSFR